MSTSAKSSPKPNGPPASRTGGGHGSRIDPESVMRIKNLELRAKVVVEGFMAGLHRSPYHGFSAEFNDYRQYSPGDDLRHLDWKLLARQDRKYIKRFEDETNLRCNLLVDLSRSMEFGQPHTKSDYARTLAATLAYFLAMQRDAVGVIPFDESVSDYLPPRFRTGHLRRLMICLDRATAGKSTDLNKPFEQIASTITKRGLIVLISDLLAPADDLTRHLSYLRSLGHDLLLLRILDPTESRFEFDAASMFRDMESGKEIYVDPQTISPDYRNRFQAHQQQIQQSCDDLGIEFSTILTDQPLDQALFDLVQTRARRGRMIKRGASGGNS